MESILGEDAVKTIEIAAKDWDYTNLAGKAAAGFKGSGSNFERSSVGKSHDTALPATEQSLGKGSVGQRSKLHVILGWEAAINIETGPSMSKKIMASLSLRG